MCRYIFLGFALSILSVKTACSQDLKFSIAPVYGSYNTVLLKDFQETLRNRAVIDFQLPIERTDDFPGYFGYELSLAVGLGKFEFGLQGASRSTGGRISYSDYSGQFAIDNYLTNKEVMVSVGIMLEKSDVSEIAAGINAGMAFTDHTWSSRLHLQGGEPLEQLLEFESLNKVLGVNFRYRYYLLSWAYAELIFRYDHHFTGELKWVEDNNAYLLDTVNGKVVQANWSGFRLGLGIGVKL